MDLRLFLAVIGRFRRLVAAITLLGVVLAVLAYGQPSFSHGFSLKPRGAEIWQSQSELLVTQADDPYGRAQQQYAPGSYKTQQPAVAVGDLSYMASIASLDAELANGDAVQHRIHQLDPGGTVSAASIENNHELIDLPLVQFTVTAPTSAGASRLARTSAATLQKYVIEQQASANIPVKQRAELVVLQDRTPPKLVHGHKLTLPLLVLFAALAAAVGLAFILENARPRTAVWKERALERVPPPAHSPRQVLGNDADPRREWDERVGTLERPGPKELTAGGRRSRNWRAYADSDST